MRGLTLRRRDMLGGAAALGLGAFVLGAAPGRIAAQTRTYGDPRRFLAAFRDWRRAQEVRAGYLPTLEEAAFDATNAMRAEAGLRPLEAEEGLRWIARFYAQTLSRTGGFDHEDEAGRGPAERIAVLHRRFVGVNGENIFKSDIFTLSEQGRAGRFAVDSLMDSPGHRRNILAPNWTHAAMGAAGDGGMFHLVQLFGQRVALLAEEAPLELPAGKALPPAFTRFAAGGADRLALAPPTAEITGADLRPLDGATAPAQAGIAATRYAVQESAQGNRVGYGVYPGPVVVVV